METLKLIYNRVVLGVCYSVFVLQLHSVSFLLAVSISLLLSSLHSLILHVDAAELTMNLHLSVPVVRPQNNYELLI